MLMVLEITTDLAGNAAILSTNEKICVTLYEDIRLSFAIYLSVFMFFGALLRRYYSRECIQRNRDVSVILRYMYINFRYLSIYLSIYDRSSNETARFDLAHSDRALNAAVSWYNEPLL